MASFGSDGPALPDAPLSIEEPLIPLAPSFDIAGWSALGEDIGIEPVSEELPDCGASRPWPRGLAVVTRASSC